MPEGCVSCWLIALEGISCSRFLVQMYVSGSYVTCVWAGNGSWWWPQGRPGGTLLRNLSNTDKYPLAVSHAFPPEFMFSSVQLLSRVWLFATPWIAARQASLSITNSWSPPKPMSIESLMPSNHLILCRPLLLPPSIFPSIKVFSNE